MQRVPYTFPLYNLPPELKIFQRSFLFFLPFQLDKIKVGGDSCYPRHFDYKSQFTVLQNWRLCWGLNSIKEGLPRSEEHTSELQSHVNLVCRLLLEKKKKA